MFKVVLIMLMLNSNGDAIAVYEPVPGFSTLEECEAARKTIEPAPSGYTIWSTCLAPTA